MGAHGEGTERGPLHGGGPYPVAWELMQAPETMGALTRQRLPSEKTAEVRAA